MYVSDFHFVQSRKALEQVEQKRDMIWLLFNEITLAVVGGGGGAGLGRQIPALFSSSQLMVTWTKVIAIEVGNSDQFCMYFVFWVYLPWKAVGFCMWDFLHVGPCLWEEIVLLLPLGCFLFSAYIGKVEVLESAAGLALEQEGEGRRERHRVPRKTLRIASWATGGMELLFPGLVTTGRGSICYSGIEGAARKLCLRFVTYTDFC